MKNTTPQTSRRSAHAKIGSLVVLLTVFSSACVCVAELRERVKLKSPLPQQIQSVMLPPTTMSPGTIKNATAAVDIDDLRCDRNISIRDVAAFINHSNLPALLLRLQRVLVGLSAGAAESVVIVTILDKTGRELATAKISERTMCPVGACVESNEATVRRNLQNLAGEVAEFVNPGEYEKKKATDRTNLFVRDLVLISLRALARCCFLPQLQSPLENYYG